MTHRATYSPEDNKIRIYPAHRLSKEEYDRVKAAGFTWAPKQELFVAPAWSPEREDFAEELCGEIEDEDTSLVERAEERAERFDEYSEKREAEADRAKAASDALAGAIPLGQPILVGHHSEKRARKDAERIRDTMSKAVKLWRTSQYWTDRAAGALAHAKYKEQPAVRARRIKTLEAERRKIERSLKTSAECLKLWETCEDLSRARLIADRTEAGWLPTAKHPSLEQYLTPSDVLPFDDRSDYAREHYPTWTLEQVKEQARKVYGNRERRDRWLEHLDNRLAYERAMLNESGGIAADKTKPEKGGACKCWASRNGWSYIVKVNKVSVTLLDNWHNQNDGDGGRNFTRTIPFDKLHALMSKDQVDEARAAGRLVEKQDKTGFVLTDAPLPERRKTEPDPKDAEFRALAEAAKNVKAVTAPTLFVTPPDLASRVVALAEIEGGMSVLEPSAGTGSLLRALGPLGRVKATAVELNYDLAEELCRTWVSCLEVRRGDFLGMNGELGQFDRVVMNPPFNDGADIRHIEHALDKLKPGGRLVAICAAGPRQRAKLETIATSWEELPAGTFKDAGTMVSAALVVIDK